MANTRQEKIRGTMRLIDKDALVAEIERKIKKYEEAFNNPSFASYEACLIAKGKYRKLKDVLSFLDTIEVKDVDFENSMVCKVDWYDGFLLDYTQEQQDELLEKIGANVGDKIRVILIKE